MLVTGPDASQLDSGGPAELERLSIDVDMVEPITDKLDFDPGFLTYFAARGDIGKLIRLDMATGRQPPLQFLMVLKKNMLSRGNKNRHGEVTR